MVTEIRERPILPADNSGDGCSLSLVQRSLENGWPLRPFQIVSLWDMYRFNAGLFFLIAREVEIWRSNSHVRTRIGKDEVDKEAMPDIRAKLELFSEICQNAGLKHASPHIKRMLNKIDGERGDYLASNLLSDSEELYHRIHDEMTDMLFMYIPKERADYFVKIDLFGSDVATNFSSANFDIEEAGSCYATDRYTACVFHSMRVLEKGLLALAADLNIVFPVSITLENWQNIIEKIESEIKAINSQPKSLQKTSDLQFYSEAAKEFRYFKDAWRNHVSHSREKYGDAEAYRVMTHVRDFMQHLAARLQE